MSDYIKYMYREYLEGRTRIKKVNEDQPLFPNTGAGLMKPLPRPFFRARIWDSFVC